MWGGHLGKGLRPAVCPADRGNTGNIGAVVGKDDHRDKERALSPPASRAFPASTPATMDTQCSYVSAPGPLPSPGPFPPMKRPISSHIWVGEESLPLDCEVLRTEPDFSLSPPPSHMWLSVGVRKRQSEWLLPALSWELWLKDGPGLESEMELGALSSYPSSTTNL